MCISRSCEVRFVCRSAHIAAQRHLVTVALLLKETALTMVGLHCRAASFTKFGKHLHVF